MDDAPEVEEVSGSDQHPKPQVNPWCQQNPKTQLNNFLMRYLKRSIVKGDMLFETVAEPGGYGFISTLRIRGLANTEGFEGIDLPEFLGEIAEDEKAAEQNAAKGVLDLFADWIAANPQIPKEKQPKKRKAWELDTPAEEYHLSFVEDGPDRSDAASQKSLNNQPAWMTRGVGVNKEIFGESQGNMLKPGIYEEDIRRMEAMKALPSDEPDPFGDVFAERSSAPVAAYDPLAEFAAEANRAPDPLAEFAAEAERSNRAPDPLAEFAAEAGRPSGRKIVPNIMPRRYADPLADFASEATQGWAPVEAAPKWGPAEATHKWAPAEAKKAPIPAGSYRSGKPMPVPTQSARYRNLNLSPAIGASKSASIRPAASPSIGSKQSPTPPISGLKPAALKQPAAPSTNGASKTPIGAGKKPAAPPKDESTIGASKKPAAPSKDESMDDIWSLLA